MSNISFNIPTAEPNIKPDVVSSEVFSIASQIKDYRKRYIDFKSGSHRENVDKFIIAFTKKYFGRILRESDLKESTEDDLKRREGQIGSSIFKPVYPIIENSFFYDDNNDWYYHKKVQTSSVPKAIYASMTYHYSVRQNEVLRIHTNNGQIECVKIEGEELNNFLDATRAYLNLLQNSLYKNI